MKLKQKFDNVEVMFEGQQGQLRYDELCEAGNQCVEIAEDFAIGFAEWINNNCFYERILCEYIYKEDSYTIPELLEIYKKENKL